MPFDFDFSDILPDWANQLIAPAASVGAQYLTKQIQAPPSAVTPGGTQFSIGGPMGISYQSFAGQGVPQQQGPGSGLVPPNAGSNGDRSYATIRAKMVDHLGFAPKRKTVNFMLRRMGADFTESALGIDQNDILWLYTHRRTSSRRHFVETYMKWCRRGDAARKRLSHFASKCGTHRSRAPSHRRRAPPAVRIVKVPSK